jgi:hypothetical protein
LLSGKVLASCASTQRELSDHEWCRSFEYRSDTREYAECRQRIDRPTDILKTLLDALGPFGMAAIAVALLVIAVEAVRLL